MGLLNRIGMLNEGCTLSARIPINITSWSNFYRCGDITNAMFCLQEVGFASQYTLVISHLSLHSVAQKVCYSHCYPPNSGLHHFRFLFHKSLFPKIMRFKNHLSDWRFKPKPPSESLPCAWTRTSAPETKGPGPKRCRWPTGSASCRFWQN